MCIHSRYVERGGVKWMRRFVFLALAAILTIPAFQPARAGYGLINNNITGPIIADGDVSRFKISSDSRYVAFSADRDTDGVIELYGVSIFGGPVVKLNNPLPVGGAIHDEDGHEFQLSAAANRVVYLADQDTDGIDELYSVPVTRATGPVKLNSTLLPGRNVTSFELTPDGQYVVYLADQDVDERFELFSVPIVGGEIPTKLNSASMIADGDVWQYSICPNSACVVFLADQETEYQNELYSVLITGGTIYKVNAPLAHGHAIYEFKITPNSLGVVYLGDQTSTSFVRDLYGNLINGSLPTPIQYSSLPDNSRTIREFAVTNERVVYVADQTTVDVDELYSVSSLGGDLHKLTSGLAAGSSVFEFMLTPNKAGAVWIEKHGSFPDDLYELYSRYLDLDVSPGGPYHLNASMTTAAYGVGYMGVSDNNTGAVYTADQDTVDTFELYRVPIGSSAGPYTKLNGTLTGGRDILGFMVMPTNPSLVIYKGRQDSTNSELYLVSTSGGAHIKLSGTCASICEVGSFTPSPDGKFVVYISGQDVLNRNELYVSYLGYTSTLPLLFR